MAPVTIDAGARNSYYSAGNIGWSARSLFAYRTAIQQLAGTASQNFGASTTQIAVAQSFTPGANLDVNEIRIPLVKTLAPTDNVSLNIYSDTGANAPNASIQAADNVYNGAAVSTAASWVAFQFATPVALTSGTKYWMVVERSGAADAANYYGVMTVGTSAYAGGGRSISNAGVWGAESATTDFAFQILTETPSALYAVTQSTEPALHVWKSTDDGATWTEQDTSNNPTVTNAVYPFDACDTRSGPYLGTAFLTATNTVRVRLFDMSTDTWGSDLGAADAATNVSNERSMRLTLDNTFVTAACGTQVIFHTDSGDDADLHHARRTTTTWSSANLIVGGTSGEASLVADVVLDKAPIGFNQRFFYDVAPDDFSIRSWTGTSGGTQIDIDAIAAADETKHASSTYQIYQASNVDKVIAAYIDSDDSIEEVTATLEVTSASVTLGTQHAVGTATTTAGRQLSTCAFDGDGYVAVSVSGTGITYYIDAWLAGSWDGGTSHLSGLTASSLSEIKNIPGLGLALIYTDNGDAKFDWIVAPTGGNVNVNGSHATATALANVATTKVTITGSNATATALANVGTPKVTVTGSVSTASALANDGTLNNDNTVTGSNATATALANDGTPKVSLTGSVATASGLANAATTIVRVNGATATASALANDGTPVEPAAGTDVNGAHATASGLANAGTPNNDNTVEGSTATASGLANVGTTKVTITGATATGSADANAGTTANDNTVTGSVATASALANVGTTHVRVNGSTASASALANDGTVTFEATAGSDVDGSHATATALANDSTTKVTITGSTATASGLANVGYPSVRAYGVQAYSSGVANTGTFTSNVSIAGSNATATGQANAGLTLVTITGSTSTASALANTGTQTNDYALAGAHATAYAQAWDGIVTVPATIAVYPANADHYDPTEYELERRRYVIPTQRYATVRKVKSLKHLDEEEWP
jgi:hypothetical protein